MIFSDHQLIINTTTPKGKATKMEENIKLEKIKKSCGVGEKVSLVFCIIAIIGCVMAIVAGIAILKMGKGFDEKYEQLSNSGYASVGETIGGIKLLHIGLEDPSNLESDIPAIQEAIKDHPYAVTVSVFAFTAALCTGIIAVMFKLAGSIFSLIGQEDNPFTDKVIKRVLIVMIVLSGIIFFTSGIASGVLCGILTWVVYTILDYGKTLQIQADETL